MKRMKNIFENFKSSLKNSKDARKAIMPKILSLAVAFCIWFYVVSVESPVVEKTFYGIPVEVVLAEGSDLEPFSGDEETVDITVRGKRSALRSIDADDIEAVLDVTDYTEAGEYNVRVDVKTPSSATVVDQTLSEVKVFLDSYASKTLDLEVKPINAPTDNDVELVWRCEPSGITLSGPESELSKAVRAEVRLDCNGNAEKEIDDNLNAILYDTNGDPVESSYLKYDSNVYVKLTPYMTKTVDLKLDITDLEEDDYGYTLKDDNNNSINAIEIRGPLNIVNEMPEIVLESPFKEKLKSDIPLPEGVTVTEGQPAEIRADVSLIYSSHEFASLPIEVRAPEGLTYGINKTATRINVQYIPSKVGNIEELKVELILELTESSTDGNYSVVPVFEGFDENSEFVKCDPVSVYVDIINEQ